MAKEEIVFGERSLYQFCTEGKQIGILRDTWERAAQDAVDAGVAVWIKEGYSVRMDVDRHEIRHIPSAKPDAPPMTPVEAAVAYALWDIANTTKLRKPEDIADMAFEARKFLQWLRVHGGDVVRTDRREPL